MIFESYYWKKDLLKIARKLSKRKTLVIWTDVDFGEFEKEIMFGFYIIRKLADARKLSSSTMSNKLDARKIPNNGKIVHLMNHHRYWEFYDFEKAVVTKLDIKFLLNQIVHSYVFSPYFSENENNCLEGIHFTSDKNRNEWLYELNIDIIIASFKDVGNDYPWDITLSFDTNKKDYTFKSTDLPPKK